MAPLLMWGQFFVLRPEDFRPGTDRWSLFSCHGWLHLEELPRAVRFDIAVQRRQFIFIEVEELHTDMKNVLSQTFGMDDSCRGIDGVMFLRRRRQVKMYLDAYTGNLSWNTLVSRQNSVCRVATATEFDTTDRQIHDHRGQVFTLG